MNRYIEVDDVMALINTPNRGNCDYFIVDKIEELCMSDKTTDEQEIRAKAIDEFAERLQEKVESFQTEINGFKADILTLDYFVEFVDEIAEEMRGAE